MDNAASLLEKFSAAKRKKKLSKKGLSEHMRPLTNKRHGLKADQPPSSEAAE